MKGPVVEEARRWLGTPYRHQASTCGAGCDCLGLLRGVWRATVGEEPYVPPYSADWDEVAREDRLLRAAQSLLVEVPIEDIAPGHVILFRMRRNAVAKHLGICTGPESFVHAYSGHGVIENRLTAPWRRRIVAAFSFPDPTFPDLQARA